MISPATGGTNWDLEFRKGTMFYEYLRMKGWRSNDILFLSKKGDPYPSKGEVSRASVLEGFEWIRSRSKYNSKVAVYISNPTNSLKEDLEEYFELLKEYIGEISDNDDLRKYLLELYGRINSRIPSITIPKDPNRDTMYQKLMTLIDYYKKIDFPDIAWLNLNAGNAISERLYLDELDELLDKIKRDKLYLIGCGVRSGLLMNRLKRHDRALITSMTSVQDTDDDLFNISRGTVESGKDDFLLGFFHELKKLEADGALDKQLPLIHFDPEFMEISENIGKVIPPVIIIPRPKPRPDSDQSTGKGGIEPVDTSKPTPSTEPPEDVPDGYDLPDVQLKHMGENPIVINEDEESITVKYSKVSSPLYSPLTRSTDYYLKK